MKIFKRIVEIAGCSAALLLFIHAASAPTEEFINHTVKKGETFSLLCIDYYGYYAPEYCSRFLRDNPSVKDINIIYMGQVLRFRNPDFNPAAEQSAAFTVEKKVSAIQGVVTFVEGDATITPKADNKKRALVSNTVAYPGDVIQTLANGKAEIILNRETVVRLRENTRLTIDGIRDNGADKGKTRIGFSIGSLWTKMKKFKDNVARFELELPTAIAGVHGTVYETTVNSDTSAEVKVFDGEVAVSNNPKVSGAPSGLTEVKGPDEVAGPHEVSMEAWVQIVRAMQRITIDKKGTPRPMETFAKNPHDTWEQWNEERDHRIEEMFREAGR
jgi:hypothetical protein